MVPLIVHLHPNAIVLGQNAAFLHGRAMELFLIMLQRKQLPFDLLPIVLDLDDFVAGTFGSTLLVDIYDHRISQSIEVQSIEVDITPNPINIAALILSNRRDLSEKSITDVESKVLRDAYPPLNLSPHTNVLRRNNYSHFNHNKYQFKRTIKKLITKRNDPIHRHDDQYLKDEIQLLLINPSDNYNDNNNATRSCDIISSVKSIRDLKKQKIDNVLPPHRFKNGPFISLSGGFDIVRSVLFIRNHDSMTYSGLLPVQVNSPTPGTKLDLSESTYFLVNVLHKHSTKDYYIDIHKGTKFNTSTTGSYSWRFYAGTVELANEYINNVPVYVEGGSFKLVWDSHPWQGNNNNNNPYQQQQQQTHTHTQFNYHQQPDIITSSLNNNNNNHNHNNHNNNNNNNNNNNHSTTIINPSPLVVGGTTTTGQLLPSLHHHHHSVLQQHLSPGPTNMMIAIPMNRPNVSMQLMTTPPLSFNNNNNNTSSQNHFISSFPTTRNHIGGDINNPHLS